MEPKGFLDRLNTHVTTAPSTVPLDVALLGAPLEEAVCIDIDHAVSSLSGSESTSEGLSFSDLTAARTPIPSNNLFVQFHTDSACIKSEFPGWLGIHMVPFSVARRSRMFSLLGHIPERIDTWAEAYTLVIYREWPLEISLAPAGMLIGLDASGAISDQVNSRRSTDFCRCVAEPSSACRFLACMYGYSRCTPSPARSLRQGVVINVARAAQAITRREYRPRLPPQPGCPVPACRPGYRCAAAAHPGRIRCRPR